MPTLELITTCSAKIADHELEASAAIPNSNSHAYHLGQILKYKQARQCLKDADSSERKFANA